MRVTIKMDKRGAGTVERKIAKQALGIELRLLPNFGIEAGDKIVLTQFPDGSGKWEKVK